LVPPTTADGSIRLDATDAPSGYDAPGAQWIEVHRPDGHVQLAAVYVPTGPGPFPTIVYLHGASGLANVQVRWARQLADAGYLVVVGCYLHGKDGDPNAFLPCDGMPPRNIYDTKEVGTAFNALVDTAKALGPADTSHMGLVGVSFGAETSLDSQVPGVLAIVGDAGYGDPAKAGNAPILLLGGTADPEVDHANLVTYENAMRAAGKDIESHYYDGAGHVVTLQPQSSADATQRIITFLDQHLK
jgi:dienelactone hydrolase